MDVPADPIPPPKPTAPQIAATDAPKPFLGELTQDDLSSPPADLREAAIEVLQTLYDPEIPVNIYDLGLIYAVDVTPDNGVTVQMTLTSPSCPVAETLPPEVGQKLRAIPGIGPVKVDLVWEPPWGKHLLSEAARLQLGMDGY